MKEDNKLNVVDEKGNIIGQENRVVIHEKGLLHQEIHLWFYTPRKEIIFQYRAKNKETYLDLLDATIGGHVEIGQTYESAAIREVKEETGLSIMLTDLTFLMFIKNKAYDKVTKRINNVIRAVYAHGYDGDFKDLRVEGGEAIGFEAWPIEKLLDILEEDKRRFIPFIIEKEVPDLLKILHNNR